MRDQWALDPTITFLNHGSFGACPRPVLAVQSEMRTRLEAEPVRFMTRELPELLDRARSALACFLGSAPANLVFVPNATTAVNTVLRSLEFAPGDELVATNHAYPSCLKALQFAAERTRSTVVLAEIERSPGSDGEVVDAVLRTVRPRTRLVMLDHVTSATSLVFPVRTLVRELESRGIMTLVDAAHSPGMLPFSLDAAGASFTAGNLHKWVCAPKGAGFLHVRADRQPLIRALVISQRATRNSSPKSRFQEEFEWVGTADPTPYLCVPSALEFMEGLDPKGWPGVMHANHSAAVAAAALLAEVVPQPLPPRIPGSMVSLLLPGTADEADSLQDRLFFEHQIEVPVIPFAGRRLIRVSMQRYVSLGDVARLAKALRTLI